MAITNSTTYYGNVTKTLHWLTALLIFSLIPMGLFTERLPFETDTELARKAWFFSLHKTLGVSAFFVALIRIYWATKQVKPALLHTDRKLENFAAETVHWALYGALVIVPLSGWISHAAAVGFAPIWWPFGQGLPLVPKSTGIEHVFGAIHWLSGKVLILSLFLHIAGALKHHFIDRDATLRRMLPGTPQLANLPAQRHSMSPFFAALVLWIAVLFAGSVIGRDHAETIPIAELVDVKSDWTVQEGSIDITVEQFGSKVSGSFANWTAAITFDEDSPEMTVGSVTTKIAIPSLTLGSVTLQAMGADFFDAESFPTAVFAADLNRANDGFEAVGTLTIRDQSMPVTLPFNLSITDGLAAMNGSITLDRRSFGVGDNMKDPSSLAFEVRVDIMLTAAQTNTD